MFTLYLDDSGARPTQPIAVASALIIPAAKICALQSEWDKFASKEGFKCFHASPCNSEEKYPNNNPKSEFCGWGTEKIDRVFARVRQVTKKYGVRAISACVKKEYFDEVVPSQYRKYVFRHHYSWCVSYVLAYSERFRRPGHPPYHFVFSWMDIGSPERTEIEKVMSYSERASREAGQLGEYEHHTIERPSGIPGLQCVDDISWVCYRYALFRLQEVETIESRAIDGWNWYGGELGDRGFLHAFHFKKSALKEHVEKLLVDGETIPRFERWEREDREKGIGI